ncbi:MAG: hypothetical protein L0322_25185, partial [Chloroflexi bacterium]|nr:hypothetical protein [Chloroflexota bacterium]
LRRRSRLTQRDLALAVGYTEAHVCRLEKNYRPPDETTIAALFVPALALEREPAWAERLLQLTTEARRRSPAATTGPQPASPAVPLFSEIPLAPAGFVPRPALLESLRRHLAAERRVALTGLAGMGKSTLAAAYARQAAAGRPVFWLTLTSGITTPVEAIVRHLAAFLLAQGLTQVRPLLSSAANQGPSLSFDQQVALLAAALNGQPALLCFDDVHLVGQDDTTLGLFRHLMATTPAALLFASREEVPLAGVPHVRLAGLEEAEALALLDQLGSRLEFKLTRLLLAKSGYSPMLLRLAAGQLLSDATADPAAFIDRLETHPQVASYLLDTVLNHLRPDSRALVEWLAILRRPADLYDDSLVDRVQQAAAIQDMPAAVAELQRRHLIHHPAQADLHPLVRDHVRATLPLRRQWQQQLHRAAAEWWETSQDNIVEAAYHCLQLNDLAQVVELLLDQGNWLFDQGQGPAAVEVVEEALARLPQRPSLKSVALRRQLLTIRGELLARTMRTAEAEENYRQALALATEPAVRAHVTARLADLLNAHGQIEEAQRLCQSAIAALAPTDSFLLARLKLAEAWTYLQKANHAAVLQLAGEVLELAHQLPLNLRDELHTGAYYTLGVVHRAQGHNATAIDYLQQGVEANQRLGQKSREYACLGQIAAVYFNQGAMDMALPLYEAVIDGLLAVGNILSALKYRKYLVHMAYIRTDMSRALEIIEDTNHLNWQLRNFLDWANIADMQVAVFLSLGQVAEARRLMDQILQVVWELKTVWGRAHYQMRSACLQMVEGDFAGAQALLSATMALPGVQNIGEIWAELQCNLAIALIAQEEIEAAQTLLAGTPLQAGIWAEIDWYLSRAAVALATGDRAAVAEAVAAVIERCQSVGDKINELRARRLLAASDNPPPPAALPWLLWVDVPTDKWGPGANELPQIRV